MILLSDMIFAIFINLLGAQPVSRKNPNFFSHQCVALLVSGIRFTSKIWFQFFDSTLRSLNWSLMVFLPDKMYAYFIDKLGALAVLEEIPNFYACWQNRGKFSQQELWAVSSYCHKFLTLKRAQVEIPSNHQFRGFKSRQFLKAGILHLLAEK